MEHSACAKLLSLCRLGSGFAEAAGLTVYDTRAAFNAAEPDLPVQAS